MRLRPLTRRVLVLTALAAASGLVLAGCGSSSPAAKPPSSQAHSGPATASSAASAIKADWVAFFASSTPVARRVALLQNGSQFQALITAQSKSSIASSASATVSTVSHVTSSQASVTYSIDVGGTPALSNQKGVAVYQNGTWKVGDTSFCGLLQLEKSSGLIKLPALPPSCLTAG